MYRLGRQLRLVGRMGNLGASYLDKVFTACVYLSYYVAGRMGLPVPRATLRCSLAGKVVKLHVRAASDFWVIKDILLDREYAVDVPEPVRTVIDLGGNIGVTAVFFATRYPAADVHVVEPNPEAFTQLLENTKAFPNVQAHQVAIAGEEGTLTLYVGKNNAGASLTRRNSSDREVTVPANTLDNFLSSIDVHSVDLLKFDLEGAERFVFRDFAGFDSVRCYVGEVHYDLSGLTREELAARAQGYTYHETFPHRPDRSILLLLKS